MRSRGNVDSSRATAGCAATRAAAGRRGNAAWRVRAAANDVAMWHCFHYSSVDVATSAFVVSTVSVMRARFLVLCNLSASLPGTPRSKMR